MLKSIEGVFRNGQVELLEPPPQLQEARVIVTFLPPQTALREPPDFTPQELAELRGRFEAWEQGWNAPGMEGYDEMK